MTPLVRASRMTTSPSWIDLRAAPVRKWLPLKHQTSVYIMVGRRVFGGLFDES
jgi:hypothetical protein